MAELPDPFNLVPKAELRFELYQQTDAVPEISLRRVGSAGHEDPCSSEAVGHIQNILYKSRKNGKTGVSTPCDPQEPSSSVHLDQSIKIKVQVNNIVNCWNVGQKEAAFVYCFEDDVSLNDIQSLLSDTTTSHYLAKGSFGSVSSSSKHRELALKKIKDDKRVSSNEILVPYKLKHCHNIVNMFAVAVWQRSFYIVQQNCGPDLRKLSKDAKFEAFFANVKNCHGFIMGMFNALIFLEERKICHADLKLENICARLENSAYIPRLVDFGTSRDSSCERRVDGVTPVFLPPKVNFYLLQVLRGERPLEPMEEWRLLFKEKSDSWAVAIVILCLFRRGDHPIKEADLLRQIDLMEPISRLTDSDIDAWASPNGIDPVTEKIVRENLRGSDSWGPFKTMEYFSAATAQQEAGTSQRSFENDKAEDNRYVPPDPRHNNNESVRDCHCRDGNDRRSALGPEKGRRPTLHPSKPYQQPQGVRSGSHLSRMGPEASRPPDHMGFRLKAVPRGARNEVAVAAPPNGPEVKGVPEEAEDEAASLSNIPNFQRLGVDCNPKNWPLPRC